MKAEELCPGDWFIAPFGYDAEMFYVVAQQPVKKAVEVGCPHWPAGQTTSLPYWQLDEDGFKYIGHGAMKPWYRLWSHPYERPGLA